MDRSRSDRRSCGSRSHVLAEITEFVDDNGTCRTSADSFRACFATACIDCTGNIAGNDAASSEHASRSSGNNPCGSRCSSSGDTAVNAGPV